MKYPRILFAIPLLFATSTVHADPADQKLRAPGAEASCRMIEAAARVHQLPIPVLTRLIWNESRFQVDAISRAGAQGIAQFMPGTSDERGLANPFDPKQAIPEAAKFLADLNRRFGNVGLAIAAYNAGPGRIASWLNNTVTLPRETGSFVLAVTGRSADDWARSTRYVNPRVEVQSCIVLRTLLRDDRSSDGYMHYGRMQPEMERSGNIRSVYRESGRLLPGALRESGRILSSMRQSGRILIGER